MSDLSELERALLNDPFNTELRRRYAEGLHDAGRYDDAAQQYELARRADASIAWPVIGLAACELAAGNEQQALDHYRAARNLEGFAPNEALEALLSKAQKTGPALSVVDGAGATVSPIRATPAEAIGFDDIAGMQSLKKLLKLQIIEPFRNPGLFQRFKKKAGGGVLLYGPPGCGKTLIARAIATECSAEFQSVGISDVLNMWIGESERNLAAVFEQARSRRPSVLFFDELDALAYSRSKSSSSAARTVVNEFLAQLDGFSADNEGVLVLAATNMPWDVDPAMRRPGRFARQVFVPPPDAEARLAIFELKMQDVPAEEIDLDTIAKKTEFFSGADIDGLIDLAKNVVLSDILDTGNERPLTSADLVSALEDTTPSTLEWLSTARNLVRFSGADNSYRDVEKYLKKIKKL